MNKENKKHCPYCREEITLATQSWCAYKDKGCKHQELTCRKCVPHASQAMYAHIVWCEYNERNKKKDNDNRAEREREREREREQVLRMSKRPSP